MIINTISLGFTIRSHPQAGWTVDFPWDAFTVVLSGITNGPLVYQLLINIQARRSGQRGASSKYGKDLLEVRWASTVSIALAINTVLGSVRLAHPSTVDSERIRSACWLLVSLAFRSVIIANTS